MPDAIPENPGITHVLYHGNCFDGHTAAWVAWNAGVPKENLLPMNYGGEAPELPNGAKVLMVDFSLQRPVLQSLEAALRASGGSLTILDHHKTAEAQLHGLDWAYFDMEESGASLAWKFFHPEDSSPKLVKYIREHDLWRFELPDSAVVRAYIRSFPMELEVWNEINTTIEMDYEVVIREGSAVKRAHEAAVVAMCKQARIVEIGGHEVPVVNATVYFSEVATRLLKLHPEAPFAAYYMDRDDGQRQWGMRSRNDFDCSAVARRYGGGGHPQAAGFQTKAPKIITERNEDGSDSEVPRKGQK